MCVLFIVQRKYFGLQCEFSCVACTISPRARHGAVGTGCFGLTGRHGGMQPEMKEPPQITGPLCVPSTQGGASPAPQPVAAPERVLNPEAAMAGRGPSAILHRHVAVSRHCQSFRLENSPNFMNSFPKFHS